MLEFTNHEITLDKLKLVGQTLLEGVVGSSLDLVVVVVQAGNMSTCELGDLTGGTTHTATDIKNLHAVLDTDLVGKVVFMTGNGLVKGLALGESAEVEGLAPSVFVEIGSKVVVAARFELVLGFANPRDCLGYDTRSQGRQRQESDHLLSGQSSILGLTGLTTALVTAMEE